MKKTSLLLLILLLMLSPVSCAANSSASTSTADSSAVAASASAAPSPEQVIYVKDAPWCKEENIKLPQLNEKELPDKTASAINKKIKALYKEMLESPGDPDLNIPGPVASYRFGIRKNILSLLLEYSTSAMPGPAPHYISYHLHLPSGKPASIQEVIQASGMTWEEVRSAYASYNDAFLLWQDETTIHDAEEDGSSLEDAMKDSLDAADEAMQSGSLAGLLDQKGLLLCMPVCIPGMNGQFIKEFYPSTDMRQVALDHTSEAILLAIIDAPTTKELAAAKPKKKITGLSPDPSWKEPTLLTAMKDDVLLCVERVIFSDTEPFAFLPQKELYRGKLGKGDSLYLETFRAEGAPVVRLQAQCGQQTRVYYFVYDGRFGTKKLEYLAGVPSLPGPIREDSSIVTLAGVLALSYHNKKSFSLENPRDFWNTVAMAVTHCQLPGCDAPEYLPLSAKAMEEYAGALRPDLQDLPKIPPTLAESKAIVYQEDAQEYQVTPCYSSTMDYEYVKTVEDPNRFDKTIWVDVKEGGKIFPYQVHLTPHTVYYPDGLFGYGITGVERR